VDKKGLFGGENNREGNDVTMKKKERERK